jgi:hypothetical protein
MPVLGQVCTSQSEGLKEEAMMAERTVWMQDVHITLTGTLQQVLKRAEDYEQEFADDLTVAVLDWGFSWKRQLGYIVLEWEDLAPLEFLARLNADNEVEDYCVYDVPCVEGIGVQMSSVIARYAHAE